MNNDTRRTILGAVLFASLFMIWNQWLEYSGKTPMFSFGKKPAVTASAPASAQDAAASLPASSSSAHAQSTSASPALAAAPAVAGEKISVSTDVLKLTFNTTGASLVGAELLHFHEQSNMEMTAFKLLDSSTSLQYMVQTGLIGGDYPNHLTPMKLVTPERELAAGKNELQVRFESDPVGGVKLVKTYTLKRGSYAITVENDATNTGTAPVTAQLYNQLVRDNSKTPGSSTFYSTYTGPAFYSDEEKYQKTPFSDIEKGKATYQKSTNNGYVAMVQQFFATAWLPEAGKPRENYVRQQDGLYAAGQIFNLGSIAPGATSTNKTTLFVGPQQEQVMRQLSPNLEAVKDYGRLTIIARPLYWLLTQLNSILHNWGWSIMALVVLLKIAFYWFNHKAYSSMAKMRTLSPKLEELKKRYPDDKEKLQVETMRMYREEKINPLGGCLPMLIQMPVFFALYSALSSTVEMRGAPWIWWIKDLAAPDPYYILPILMTASSLLQVWLNPKPSDPTQAKLMWLMPLSFAFMFFFFPSGLVLYWVTNNLLSIAQQWSINRHLEKKK